VEKWLTKDERNELRRLHRRTAQLWQGDRIKAIVHLDAGWTYEEVAEALLIDDETCRRWGRIYRKQGIDALLVQNYQGGEGKLNEREESELKNHLEQTLDQTTKEIIHYVSTTYGVQYSISGMHALLHRCGFVYKKCRHVPSKADETKQRAFVTAYGELKKQKQPEDRVLFVDGCHPQHNSLLACGWMPKGQEHYIAANTGRKRLNINGAIEPESLEVITRSDQTLNADATIAFFKDIEQRYPLAPVIYLILDNAGYYRAAKVSEFLKSSRIKLLFLPPYSPNLNLIERLWKFFKRNVLYNKYYESFAEFQQAVGQFFSTISSRHSELKTLITENFQIIHAHSIPP
jgi:transposase